MNLADASKIYRLREQNDALQEPKPRCNFLHSVKIAPPLFMVTFENDTAEASSTYLFVSLAFNA